MTDPIIRVRTKDPRDGHKDVAAEDLVLAMTEADKDLRALIARWRERASGHDASSQCADELERWLEGEELLR